MFAWNQPSLHLANTDACPWVYSRNDDMSAEGINLPQINAIHTHEGYIWFHLLCRFRVTLLAWFLSQRIIRLKNNIFIEIYWMYAIKFHILMSQIATLSVTNRDTRHKLRHLLSQIATPSQNATITNCYVTRRRFKVNKPLYWGMRFDIKDVKQYGNAM